MSESPPSTPDDLDPKATAGSRPRGPEGVRDLAGKSPAGGAPAVSAEAAHATGMEGGAATEDLRKERRKELREDVKAWQAGVAIVAALVGLPTTVSAWRTIFAPAKPLAPLVISIATPVPTPTSAPATPRLLTDAEKLEMERLKNELEKARPHFQVTYLLVPVERFGVKETAEKKGKEEKSDSSKDHLGPFEDAVTVENPISAYAVKLRDSDYRSQDDSTRRWTEKDIDWTTTIAAAARLKELAKAGKLSTTLYKVLCLQLTQLGSRAANDLELSVRHFEVPKAVDVHDVSVLTTDRWIASRQPQGAEKMESFSWNTIEPGEKVLIPLGMVEDVDLEAGKEPTNSKEPSSWNLLRGDLYLPVQLKSQDPCKDQPDQLPIRKMKANPVLTLSGVETRG